MREPRVACTRTRRAHHICRLCDSIHAAMSSLTCPLPHRAKAKCSDASGNITAACTQNCGMQSEASHHNDFGSCNTQACELPAETPSQSRAQCRGSKYPVMQPPVSARRLRSAPAGARAQWRGRARGSGAPRRRPARRPPRATAAAWPARRRPPGPGCAPSRTRSLRNMSEHSIARSTSSVILPASSPAVLFSCRGPASSPLPARPRLCASHVADY